MEYNLKNGRISLDSVIRPGSGDEVSGRLRGPGPGLQIISLSGVSHTVHESNE